MMNIAVFVSGGGTNLQALIDAQNRGEIKNGKITFVLASNDGAYALERAKKAGIPTAVVSRKSYSSKEEYDKAILAELDGKNIDLIVLAGFLSILGKDLVEKYANKIINIHPSLIPLFCGDGFRQKGAHGCFGKRNEGHRRNRSFCKRNYGRRRNHSPKSCFDRAGRQRGYFAIPRYASGGVGNSPQGCFAFLRGQN